MVGSATTITTLELTVELFGFLIARPVSFSAHNPEGSKIDKPLKQVMADNMNIGT